MRPMRKLVGLTCALFFAHAFAGAAVAGPPGGPPGQANKDKAAKSDNADVRPAGGVNQGDPSKVLTVPSGARCTGTPVAGAKVEGGLGRTVTVTGSPAIAFVSLKSGQGATLVSASFSSDFRSATITLSKDVSNYVVYTCETAGQASVSSPPAPPKQEDGKRAKGKKGEKREEREERSNGSKVTICHATGSASNPYVLITISENALDAHRTHQGGRDIIPAPAGGCPGAQAASEPRQQEPPDAKVTICHATGSASNPYVLITISENALDAHRSHQGGRDIIPAPAGGCPAAVATETPPATTTTSAPATTQAAAQASEQRSSTTRVEKRTVVKKTATRPATKRIARVKGVRAERPVKAAAPAERRQAKPTSGVLGATKTLTRKVATGTLPFTGIPLWAVALAALALLGIGIALRRTGRLPV